MKVLSFLDFEDHKNDQKIIFEKTITFTEKLNLFCFSIFGKAVSYSLSESSALFSLIFWKRKFAFFAWQDA